ncbi:MAG TPA: FkbM family methyltransferase [Actinomycetes bacterium]|nr:FkbM family methyltransferase [Actinomycetes bacterium]
MIRSAVFRAFSVVFSRVYGTPLARAIWRVPGSRTFYAFLMGRLRPEEVTVRGHVMRLDPLDSLLLSVNGTYEEEELDLLRDCIRPGDTILDVGGHIGLYTLEASRAAGAEGRVVTFEPSTANYALLEHNVRLNGCTNVVLVKAAVSNADGELTLVLSHDNSGDHQITTDPSTSSDTERVRTVSIDSYCRDAGITTVNVVKMDIQGAEPVALAGALRTIGANPDVLLFTEVSPQHLASRGGTDAYLVALADAGFDLWQMEGGGAVPRTVAELSHLRIAAGTEHTDLVCVKGGGSRARLEDALGRRDPEAGEDASGELSAEHHPEDR